jgi:hypothetical protein
MGTVDARAGGRMGRIVGIALGVVLLAVIAGPRESGGVDGGSGLGMDSAHNTIPWYASAGCVKCHIAPTSRPVEGASRFWDVKPTITTVPYPPVQTDFLGVHNECNSCHYSGNPVGAFWYTVFRPGVKMNHPMHEWADINGPTLADYDEDMFPLDPSDKYRKAPWRKTNLEEHTAVGRGFYCLSCHDVHRQPRFKTSDPYQGAAIDGNGDYLRGAVRYGKYGDFLSYVMTYEEFGTSNARLGACTQCHGITGPGCDVDTHGNTCSTCHHPHEGAKLPDGTKEGNDLAEKILTREALERFYGEK